MSTKSVLITGASTGIGEACAYYLDARGFQVFAGVRKESDGAKLSARASEKLTPVPIDVVDRDAVAAAVDTVASRSGGKLDGLVNNAGISVNGPIELVPLERFQRQFDVNVFGQISVTQAFLPMLRAARGRIVNMSSISGRVTAPLLGPYSMSKFALEAFSDALRRELHPWGIQVSSVEPGAIDTPIWNKGLEAPENQPENIPPRGAELYGDMIVALRKLAAKTAAKAVPPERVARVVHHALTARKPKTRYLVGPDAWMQAFVARWLPDRWLDGLLRRLVGLTVQEDGLDQG